MADILVADDDAGVRECVKDALEGEGHSVRLAADGAAALAAWRARRPDLLILDVMMPVRSGKDVIAAVRAEDPVAPVMFLTARNLEQDVAEGLELGADDYVTKPIRYREFLARVSAALRRGRLLAGRLGACAAGDAPFRIGSSLVDAPRRELEAPDGVRTKVSRREIAILRLLADSPGAVVGRDAFFNEVWGREYSGTTRTLDTFMSALRRKLGDDARLIETVPGDGYRYRPPAGGAR